MADFVVPLSNLLDILFEPVGDGHSISGNYISKLGSIQRMEEEEEFMTWKNFLGKKERLEAYPRKELHKKVHIPYV